MSTADGTTPPTGESLTVFRRWMIMAAITSSTTLYAMTILIVSVVLPQMQGSLSATPDQISWVMTFNILATAVVTPMSGWLAGRFGWRRVMLVSQAGFCIATFLCGIADSLESLVLYRIMQGAFGAPTIPLAQAIILDIFPRRQHSLVTSIFGMGVVVGPILGPIFGGYLTELYNWRYAFYMLVPLAAFGFFCLWVFLNDGGRRANIRFDWTGFLLLAASIASLQLVLDRGQRLDWLDSYEIILEIVIGCCAIYAFLIHSFMAERPFLDLRLLADRNYSFGLLIV
ncbi:MAG: DHA2 family efflux MFS transporter permease subunit, partial [Alphaproteobacteria bacterium]|nr:DHA2 family efflux MFS transporter permease subunit [Alphaproteobacteria bacterium]